MNRTSYDQIAERWSAARAGFVGKESPYLDAVLEPILCRVVRRLPAGSRLMVTVGGSDHPPFTNFMFDQDFFYDSSTPEETERVLSRLGCRLVLAELMNLPDGGRDKGRYAIVAEKK
ncbi:MAG: hypothetical protein KDD11_23175 [Acidobacteria bacterium]|nr:hypothetical protein [Acidobacteriota bacterium]